MTAIAIFVKTPGHSPVKTRLAAAIGQAATESVYLASARTVAEVAVASNIGPVYWAVAEPAAVGASCWADLPILGQGHGGLGERMAGVHTELVERHGAGILLGADAPQIEADPLATASHWLGRSGPRLAIGPARDGGFWLFGANHAIDRERWVSVPYSSPETRAAFRTALDGCGEWLTLPVLTDLDQTEDIPAVVAELLSLAAPLPGQSALAAQLDRERFPVVPSADERD